MLRVEKLRVVIEGFEVLRGVSFEVKAGSTVALIGRNGAGKTTTLRAIMGLVQIQGGRILFYGQDLTPLPPYRRAVLGIGYAPEDRRLIGEFTVEDNLLLPLLAQGVSLEKRTQRLAEVYSLLPELEELRSRPAGSLSGGQGKMVALGRALMTGEKLILLDEPFQGLAPALALNYARILKRLREVKNEVAILVTESNSRLLQGLAEEVLYIERGEISTAPPEDL